MYGIEGSDAKHSACKIVDGFESMVVVFYLSAVITITLHSLVRAHQFAYLAEIPPLLQIAFYFGYMAVVCYAFLLMLGTVGFRASLTFVRYRALHGLETIAPNYVVA